ncbi:hypothetical protein HYH03_010282 [Edaphochlamys debaryana]|uniref:Protein kinase domain-containing protein n=1 Tax=Edaphochlamys debaryana TaxID=47281 RepID=A0A836BWA7_9CHLO|nr:hypothetical protein HYH03_010282 [Edaphochlamys debaryana]|eukprot:KAG2491275.1 hypothetical protein HYH03_010282 [Edaphochlamys debaryana]
MAAGQSLHSSEHQASPIERERVSLPDGVYANGASIGDTTLMLDGPAYGAQPGMPVLQNGGAAPGAPGASPTLSAPQEFVGGSVSTPTGGTLSKLLRPTTLKNVSGALGSRPTASGGAEGKGLLVEVGRTDSRRSNHSGLSSGRRQDSVVPELPFFMPGSKQASSIGSAGECCGWLLSSDGRDKRIVPCTRHWWRALSRGLVLEYKKVTEVVRRKPLILLPGLAVMGIILGLGLWAVLAAADNETATRLDTATRLAADKAQYLSTELDKTFMPAYVVSATVQQDPYYYPPQPPDLWDIYPNKWYLVNAPFDKLSRDLIALTRAGSVRTVSAIPHGVIRTMYPLYGKTPNDDRNWGAIGKNWLNDSANAASVKLALSSRTLTIIGPYNLTQGGIGIVAMMPIFVNGTQNDTWGVPPGPDGLTGSSSPIPGMLDLVWQPQFPEAPAFWGLCTVLISWDALRDNVTRLQDLQDQGYNYVLTRPGGGDTELAVDWSRGLDPPRPPGFDESVSGVRPLVYYNLHQGLDEPIVVKVALSNVHWTLYVVRTDGWVPSWKAPIIALVVILSVVLSTLVLAVLVSRAQQRKLFRDVVEAAGQLANTTRSLEDEKNRMQALLARHYDLLDLLEGGHGGVAASIGGAGALEGAGPRSHADILRQKVLLTGSSLRREQLGEAEQVTIQELLGEGTFGKVYKGLWRGTEVAIKTIVLPAKMSGKEKREKMAVMEAAISSTLAHPNIVTTYTYHIRPLRDSSALMPPATPSQPVPPASASPAAGSVSAGGTGIAPLGQGASPAGGSLAEGRTALLASDGAIVVGTPDSSVSGTSVGAPAPATTTAAAAEAAAAVAGVGTVAASAGGAANPPTGPGAASSAGAAAAGARGASLDGPTGGIHSYEVQLVLEYCDRGCLRDALDAGAFFSADGLNYPAILDTCADVAKALLHLHLNDVLHGDLKATNVMLRSVGNDSGRGVVAKVADFGLSVRLDHAATHVSHMFQGSLTHMAPEVMLHGHVSRAADVYAFGITMWEIFTSGHPYRGTPGALLGHQTSKEGRRPVFPLGTPADFRQLAEACWHPDASQRPSFGEILETLGRLRAEIPGPTPTLQNVTSLAKRMAAAAGANGAAAAHGAAVGTPIGNGGAVNGTSGARGNGGNGLLYGSGTGAAGMPGIAQLPKLQSGGAAVQVGGRILSLSAAMHAADSRAGMGAGLCGPLETIEEHDQEAEGGRTGHSTQLRARAREQEAAEAEVRLSVGECPDQELEPEWQGPRDGDV